ncbi:type II CAAX endopeptidase family protein [Leptolyngbya sp. CCNP1308]|uniref:CPBP family intramembrane glutamic endopeptidase n=1 Tax=Leptolyngbya sp. CCNP1308 TaxID=3110255 RepID=UPI002B1F1CDA|nr:type II CAAX endopeptidase family protein [Leptolyngbya sp. CCNP1308]MEA5449542.1 type II CAAX endopeptidase family protein [Leptolyngbya sp. CCNP1308]
MSQVPSNHPQESEKTAATPSFLPNKASRPRLPEGIVGLVVFMVVGYGVGSQLSRLGLDPVVYGLVFTALSGIAGIAGFAAAVLLRIRSLSPFGVRPVSRRWLLIGVGAGLVAFMVKGLAVLAYIAITGDSSTPQTVYAEGGSGGVLSLILATLFLGLLTPLGEELLFRGVIANVLLRHGRPFFGVVGSALIFAFMHGVNIVFPAALVMGLVGAELLRRSGSVWPAVVVHVVFNLPTVPVMVLAGMG